MATQAKDGAQETTGQAKADNTREVGQKASEVGQQARRKAAEVGQQAVQVAESQVERRKSRVASGMHTFGEALRLGAEDLRQRGDAQDTRYVDRLADQADRVSDYLERTDPREMVREVESFARRNQALFLGGALALGVLGARFLKSSPPDDMPRTRGDWDARPTTGRALDEDDAVGRPGAPGYAPPAERETAATGMEAPGRQGA